MWNAGQLNLLLNECRAIQTRLIKKHKSAEENTKAFSRLMLQGRVSAALRFIGSEVSSVLPTTTEVLQELKAQHPVSVKPKYNSIIKGPYPRKLFETVIFDNIDATLIYDTAKRISGAAGPSGADAEMWQRLLCSRQFKQKPSELCQCIAELARKLCTKPINPSYLRAFTAGRSRE